MKESKKPTGNFEQKMEVRVSGGEIHFIIQASSDGNPQEHLSPGKMGSKGKFK